ncbi:MAG: FliM/FliN family flagellar motor switch protein [Planctomycetes bacterium]|nr:FliM/FliN family flagellar motor switch protein [Planctomycetota bacterium]
MTITQAAIDDLLSAAAPSIASRGASAPAAPSPPAGAGGTRHADPGLQRILGLSVPVAVVLAERDMTVESILAVRVGTIIEFDVPFEAALTLYVANRPIGAGHAVKVGENFGLRLTSVGSVEQRIDAMGRR